GRRVAVGRQTCPGGDGHEVVELALEQAADHHRRAGRNGAAEHRGDGGEVGQEHVGHGEVEPAGDRAGVVEHGHAVGDAVAGGVGAVGRPVPVVVGDGTG